MTRPSLTSNICLLIFYYCCCCCHAEKSDTSVNNLLPQRCTGSARQLVPATFQFMAKKCIIFFMFILCNKTTKRGREILICETIFLMKSPAFVMLCFVAINRHILMIQHKVACLFKLMCSKPLFTIMLITYLPSL